MSANGTIDSPHDGNIIAGEYVLGVLSAAERREVERRLAREPALASEVALWEERLTGLADAVAPVAPPDAVWSRIERAIGTGARAPSVWQSLTFWRSLSIVSATLATASIAALVYIGLVPGARVPLMATLSGGAGQPNFVASVTATGNSLVIVPAALLTNDPRAYELWLIPTGETRPRSLGLVQPGQPIRLDIPSDLAGRVTPDATLAVSLEPPGGSPTGLPTGPVVAAGKLTNM
ncbi:MAG TPA: anti-sigma factor [Xanthobacteraceae bacterium]|nr:anti-sigma factor [Xanthobacteraceae bacterium]